MPSRIRPIIFRVAAALLVTGGSAASANAQVVRGRLVDAADDAGVGGAMISLMDRDGRQLSQVLTRDSGLFELSAPISGNYRLRADRIGYATTFSDYFDLTAADTLSFRMVAAVQAVSLQGIIAEADRRCRVRPGEGLAVTRVWDEARKALSAAAWTQERGYYRYEIESIRRELGPAGRKVISENRIYERSYRRSPYVSRPAAELIEEGFARLSANESVYWAPDADVLLSDPFLDTHCFRVNMDENDAPGLIGLEFEPVPGRNLPEIAGTLWLDPATSQLTRLDFRYRNLDLPLALLGGDIGGTVEFRALPNGTWIVNSWRIRMPRGGTRNNPLNGRILTVLEGLTVQGADVLRVHGDEGTVLEGDVGGRIAGIIFDSLRAGLEGARVFVEGTGIEAVTDRDGRFDLTRLEPGIYSVNFTHPYLETFSYRPEPFEVEVVEGAVTPAQVNFAAPTIGRVLGVVCRDDEPPDVSAGLPWGSALRYDGVLVGQVTDEAGEPLSGATVRVLLREYDVRASDASTVATIIQSRRSGVAVTTNESGHYLACWVPVNTDLRVAVMRPDQELDPNRRQAAYTMSELIAGVEERVIIPPDLLFATVNLRVEPN